MSLFIGLAIACTCVPCLLVHLSANLLEDRYTELITVEAEMVQEVKPAYTGNKGIVLRSWRKVSSLCWAAVVFGTALTTCSYIQCVFLCLSFTVSLSVSVLPLPLLMLAYAACCCKTFLAWTYVRILSDLVVVNKNLLSWLSIFVSLSSVATCVLYACCRHHVGQSLGEGADDRDREAQQAADDHRRTGFCRGHLRHQLINQISSQYSLFYS